MATQRAGTGAATTPGSSATVTVVNYSRPLAVVTSLFFMWGFLTCLNDILVPHLKSIVDLNYSEAMLIEFAFFSAYLLFSIPWSRFVNRIGYHRTMVVGLITMACGAFLFLPAASAASYGLFLTALLILAAGITGLQVAANPYVDLLGKPETASSRLDFPRPLLLLPSAGQSPQPAHRKSCRFRDRRMTFLRDWHRHPTAPSAQYRIPSC